MEIAADRIFPTLAAPPSRSAANVRGAGLSRRRILLVATLCALLGLGAFLRIYPSSGYQRTGFDEHGYAVFVKEIQAVGFLNYDAVVKVYLERQRSRAEANVPATRIGFLAPATLVANVFRFEPMRALKVTSCLASLLLFGRDSRDRVSLWRPDPHAGDDGVDGRCASPDGVRAARHDRRLFCLLGGSDSLVFLGMPPGAATARLVGGLCGNPVCPHPNERERGLRFHRSAGDCRGRFS